MVATGQSTRVVNLSLVKVSMPTGTDAREGTRVRRVFQWSVGERTAAVRAKSGGFCRVPGTSCPEVQNAKPQ